MMISCLPKLGNNASSMLMHVIIIVHVSGLKRSPGPLCCSCSSMALMYTDSIDARYVNWQAKIALAPPHDDARDMALPSR